MSETTWQTVCFGVERISVPTGWIYWLRSPENRVESHVFVPEPPEETIARWKRDIAIAVEAERARCRRIVMDRIDGGTDAGKHIGDGDLSEMIREIEGRTR